jgi:hypothetical protein
MACICAAGRSVKFWSILIDAQHAEFYREKGVCRGRPARDKRRALACRAPRRDKHRKLLSRQVRRAAGVAYLKLIDTPVIVRVQLILINLV